jgi:hypothetical protein
MFDGFRVGLTALNAGARARHPSVGSLLALGHAFSLDGEALEEGVVSLTNEWPGPLHG